MDRKTRIAIIGGGMCGCSLANGLMQHQNIEFDVFESKSAFGERGAAVSLDINACNALKSMGLSPEQMLKNAGAVMVDASRCIIALGEHRGEPLIELPGGTFGVTRTKWLDELLKSLPRDRLHAGKKLHAIADGGNEYPCLLSFEDGSSYEADAVIGCDGIHSTVRRILLEDQHPDRIEAVFGGYWDARGVTTPGQAAERFGTDLFDPQKPTRIALTGNGAFMVFRPSDDNTRYTIIVSAVADPSFDGTTWKQPLTQELLGSTFSDWDPKFRDAVTTWLLSDGQTVAFSQYESPVAPYYTDGRICIIGDAAHAMLPWMGVGAEMAIEDAAVLTAVLGVVKHGGVEDIHAALLAYQQTRHGISERLMRQNHEAAKIITGQYGLDPARISEMEPEKWWADVRAMDLSTHIDRTIAAFRNIKDGASKNEA